MQTVHRKKRVWGQENVLDKSVANTMTSQLFSLMLLDSDCVLWKQKDEACWVFNSSSVECLTVINTLYAYHLHLVLCMHRVSHCACVNWQEVKCVFQVKFVWKNSGKNTTSNKITKIQGKRETLWAIIRLLYTLAYVNFSNNNRFNPISIPLNGQHR